MQLFRDILYDQDEQFESMHLLFDVTFYQKDLLYHAQ